MGHYYRCCMQSYLLVSLDYSLVLAWIAVSKSLWSLCYSLLLVNVLINGLHTANDLLCEHCCVNILINSVHTLDRHMLSG